MNQNLIQQSQNNTSGKQAMTAKLKTERQRTADD